MTKFCNIFINKQIHDFWKVRNFKIKRNVSRQINFVVCCDDADIASVFANNSAQCIALMRVVHLTVATVFIRLRLAMIDILFERDTEIKPAVFEL